MCIYRCVCVCVCNLYYIYIQLLTPPTQPTPKQQDNGEEITFDFEGEDDEDAAATSETEQAPTPDDDPYVLWPPEVEKMPLGDICFLLRSGVIAAKNVPERRAGALVFWSMYIICVHAPTSRPWLLDWLITQNQRPQTQTKTALDALGFDWGNEEAYVDLRWDIFLGTYYYWRLIKGVPLVPWDFVVPEEAPWPFFCRGVELGRMCDMVRRHQEVCMFMYP